MSLEQWSYLATTLAGVATLILVGFNAFQVWMLRQQVKSGTDAATAAEQSVAVTQEAVREATRARIDEQAPRVVCLLEAPQWPPLIDSQRSHMPYGNELRLLNPRSVERSVPADSSKEFIFPESANWFLWFITRGILINEGRSTARVRLNGEGQFIEGETSLVPEKNVPYPPVAGTSIGAEYLFREHLLRPGEVALFEWGGGSTMKDWAERREQPKPVEVSTTVQVFDSTTQGIQDVIKLELRACLRS